MLNKNWFYKLVKPIFLLRNKCLHYFLYFQFLELRISTSSIFTIYIYIYMFAIAGQTAAPNRLKILSKPWVPRGVLWAKIFWKFFKFHVHDRALKLKSCFSTKETFLELREIFVQSLILYFSYIL